MALLTIVLSACSLIATRGPDPGPMIYREIWWANHTHDTFEMRITEAGNLVGAGLVEPCAPGGMGQPLKEVFAFMLTAPGDPTSESGTFVTDSQAWQEAGDRHIVAMIWPDGEVEVEFRAEPPAMSEKFCGEGSQPALADCERGVASVRSAEAGAWESCSSSGARSGWSCRLPRSVAAGRAVRALAGSMT